MRILHISDIQEGKFGIKPDLKKTYSDNWQKEYQLILNDIKAVFKRIHSEKPVDVIIFSGDLASKGNKEEYHKLQQEFIAKLTEIFPENNNDPRKHWLFVPGNHDVQWGKGEHRFDEFINFCHNNGFHKRYELGKPYSIFDIFVFTDKNTKMDMEIILLNSSLEIYDEDTRKNSNIPEEYFNQIEEELDDKTWKIMVSHHRLVEIESNITSNKKHCLKKLRDRKVFLALVGDFHESQDDVNKICGIKSITAGALMAKKSQRTVGIDVSNRQFNVYDIDFNVGMLQWSTYKKTLDWEENRRKSIELPFGFKKDVGENDFLIHKHPDFESDLKDIIKKWNEIQKEFNFILINLQKEDESFFLSPKSKIDNEEASQKADYIRTKAGYNNKEYIIIFTEAILGSEDLERLFVGGKEFDELPYNIGIISLEFLRKKNFEKKTLFKSILLNILYCIGLDLGLRDHGDETRGCIMDFCSDMNDIKEGITEGPKLCGDCKRYIIRKKNNYLLDLIRIAKT